MDHPNHKMEIAVDDGAIVLTFHCDAPEGAKCRMLPKCIAPDSTTLCYPEEGMGIIHNKENCEHWRDPDDDQVDYSELPKVDTGECWVSSWFEGQEEILNSTEVGTSVIVPVEVNWLGDYMGWSFQNDNSEDISKFITALNKRATELKKEHPQYRIGQSLFSALWESRPDLANEVRGTNLDPFHDNSRITAFYSFIEERLK